MLRAKLQQLLYGRSGPDQLSQFTLLLAVILWFFYLFLGWIPVYVFSLVFLVFTFFRIFSRNIDKRRAENARYLSLVRPVRRWLSGIKTRLYDKEHRYFRCPNCHQQMRVPKGKGKIQVTCHICGAKFEEKS